MARKKKNKRGGPPAPRKNAYLDPNKLESKKRSEGTAKGGQAIRETVESLVIAFVLAFLFRTFQAEAFVIPTGSMAPTLMGRHKDVFCDQCGQRYKVNASNEGASSEELAERFRGSGGQRNLRQKVQCVGGVCPTCRYPMPFRPDIPSRTPRPPGQIEYQPTHSGDRILVNKYLYEFTDPKRWDVIVFKFPGDANTNYIKRLVGLPNEELRIEGGDVFVRPSGSDEPFAIARKPPKTVLAMSQLVHDTDRDAAALKDSGWPLRWSPDSAGGGWEVETKAVGASTQQVYRGTATGQGVSWLRYEHTPAGYEAWRTASGANGQATRELQPTPELIGDYNAYNSELSRYELERNGLLALQGDDAGLHWTGDLLLEADVQVESDSGRLLFDLVEGGRHFTCTIDLSTGEATLSALQFETGEEIAGFSQKAKTRIRGAGFHRIRFANVDDQLLLWVDGSLEEFDSDTTYDSRAIFGERSRILPRAYETDRGDLAPAGIGLADAKAEVTRLQVWRDIYYIAASWRNRLGSQAGAPVTDFELSLDGANRELRVETESGMAPVWAVIRNQDFWSGLEERRAEDFVTGDDQFFVMGDNSAASLDCRLWNGGSPSGGSPGGPYLERSLLIGKAVCVYWPHSWNRIPGTSIPAPLFPNVQDMRLVR